MKYKPIVWNIEPYSRKEIYLLYIIIHFFIFSHKSDIILRKFSRTTPNHPNPQKQLCEYHLRDSIIIKSHWLQGFPKLSLFIRPNHASLLAGLQNNIQCPYSAGRPTLARSCVGVHRRTSLMSSSLLLQLCPTSRVCLTWIVFEIVGRWPNNCCFIGFCFQYKNLIRVKTICFLPRLFVPTGKILCTHFTSPIYITTYKSN